MTWKRKSMQNTCSAIFQNSQKKTANTEATPYTRFIPRRWVVCLRIEQITCKKAAWEKKNRCHNIDVWRDYYCITVGQVDLSEIHNR